jgi:DNA-binding MarR family transcriptional regulator
VSNHSHPGNHDAQELPLLLRRLTVELEAFGHGFADQHGLHPTDVRAIVVIMDGVRSGQLVRPVELSQQLGLTTASVTGLLDRLEKQGHIRRSRHPSDRRGVAIELTEETTALGRAYFGGLRERMLAALAGFEPAQLRAARGVLEALLAAVPAPPAPGP